MINMRGILWRCAILTGETFVDVQIFLVSEAFPSIQWRSFSDRKHFFETVSHHFKKNMYYCQKKGNWNIFLWVIFPSRCISDRKRKDF